MADTLSDAVDSVRCMRSALTAVIAGIPGFRFQRPNDLSTELGLDPKLAWNLGRCIEESDPFATANFLPGPTGIKKFLDAAKRRQTPAALIDAARSASMRFNDVVKQQAGSRKDFNSLMTGNSSAVRPSADLDHRRRAYEGNSYIWGVHARTVFRSNLIMPSSDPERYDCAAIRGFIDFTRLRPNVAWRITLPVSVDADRVFHNEVSREPIDPNASSDASALPLMLDYCTHPLPEFRPVRGAFGQNEFEFIAGSVGVDSRITCITGEVLRRVEPRYRSEAYDDLCFTFPIQTPARTLILDTIIHRHLFDAADALRAELYSDLFAGGPDLYYENSDRLPLHDPLIYLGAGPDVVVTPDIPGYDDFLRLTMDRYQCRRDDYDVFRIRIEYPPIATRLMVRRPLPVRPVSPDAVSPLP